METRTGLNPTGSQSTGQQRGFFLNGLLTPPQTPVLLSAPHHEMNKPDKGLVSSYRTVILAFSFLLSCNPDVLVSGCGLFPNLLALFSQ